MSGSVTKLDVKWSCSFWQKLSKQDAGVIRRGCFPSRTRRDRKQAVWGRTLGAPQCPHPAAFPGGCHRVQLCDICYRFKYAKPVCAINYWAYIRFLFTTIFHHAFWDYFKLQFLPVFCPNSGSSGSLQLLCASSAICVLLAPAVGTAWSGAGEPCRLPRGWKEVLGLGASSGCSCWAGRVGGAGGSPGPCPPQPDTHRGAPEEK